MKLTIFYILMITIQLYCNSELAAQTPGTLKWKFKTGSALTSSPAIADDNTIYVTSKDGNLYSINPDGTQKWAVKTGASIISSPVINSEGSIYFYSEDKNIYAVSSTGVIQWKYPCQSDNAITPVIDSEDNLYFGKYTSPGNSFFFSLDAEGNLRWETKINSSILISPVVGADGMIYFVTMQDVVYAIERTGKISWVRDFHKTTTLGGEFSTLSVTIGRDGTIYYPSNNNVREIEMRALTPYGSLKWSVKPKSTTNYIYTSSVIGQNGNIYFGNYSLDCIDSLGNKIWSTDLNGSTYSTPLIGNDGTIYCSSKNSMNAFNSDGNLIWKFDASKNIKSSPSLGSNGIIYFGDDEGNLNAVYTSSAGYINSFWPKFRKDNYNSGNCYNINNPVAVVANDSLFCNINETVTLRAKDSYDPDNENLVYNWKLINGAEDNEVLFSDTAGSEIQVTIKNYGIYEFALLLSDNNDGVATRIVKVYCGVSEYTQFESNWISGFAIDEEDNIYFGTDDNYFYSLDKNHNINWKIKLESSVLNFPVIGNNRIYFATWNNTLYSLTKEGSVSWSFNSENSYLNSSVPIIGTNGLVYIASDSKFYAIDSSGSIQWSYNDNNIDNYAKCAVGIDGSIYLASRYKIYVFSRLGDIKWTYDINNYSVSHFAIDNKGTCYIVIDGTKLYAIKNDGTLKWIFVSQNYNTFSDILIDNENNIIISNGNNLITLDENGSIIQEIPQISGTKMLTMLSTLYSSGSQFYAFELNGNKEWYFNLGSSFPYSSYSYSVDNTGNLHIVASSTIFKNALFKLNTNDKLLNSAWPKLNKDLKNSNNNINPNNPVALVKNALVSSAITQPFYLDGSNSFDPNGDNLIYEWKCVEKPEGSIVNIYNPESPLTKVETDFGGDYEFQLHVTDNIDGDSYHNVVVKNGFKWLITLEYISGSPAIDADSNIYLNSAESFYILNKNGEKIYSQSGGNSVNSSPVMLNDKIYYVSGKEIRITNNKNELLGKKTFSDYITSGISVGANGSIYFLAGDYPFFDSIYVYSVNSDLTENWKKYFSYDDIESFPAVGPDGTLYVISKSGDLYAYNKTGEEKWKFHLGTTASTPSISNSGVLYVGTNNGNLYSINPDGTENWRFVTNGKITTTPIIGPDGVVYAGSQDKKIYAINPNGEKKWEFETSGSVTTTPVIGADSILYIGSGKMIYAFDKDGKLKWQIESEQSVRNSPTINYDGTLLFGVDDGQIIAIQTTSHGIAHDGWPKFGKNLSNTNSNYNPDNPVAVVNVRTISTKINENFILDGSSSYDHNNNELSYEWRCIEKPSETSYVIADSLIPAPEAYVTEAGLYKFKLKVSDDVDGSSYEIVKVISGLLWEKEYLDRVSSVTVGTENQIAFGAKDSIYFFPNENSFRWKDKIEGYLYSAPLITQNNICFLTSSPMQLYCYDHYGNKNYQIKFDGYLGGTYPVIGKDNNDIYIAAGDRVFCYSLSGNYKWEFILVDAVSVSPVVDKEGTIYIGCRDKNLYALEPNGELKWKIEVEGEILTTPAIGSDNSLYFCDNQNKIYSISNSGTLKWSIQIDNSVLSSPVIDNENTIYFVSTNGTVYAVDPDGNIKWSYTQNIFGAFYSPVIGDNGLIYVPLYNNMLAFDKYGNVKWEYQIDGTVRSHLTLSNTGTLFIPTYENKIYAIQTTSNGLADSPWPKFQYSNTYYSQPTSVKSLELDFNFSLHSNYPNPFNPTTTIEYEIPKTTFVTIKIYDIMGREIRSIINEEHAAGRYKINFDGSNLASGVYFYRLLSNEFQKTKKMILLK